MNSALRNQLGASLLEYSLLTSLLVMLSIGAVTFIGKQTRRPACLVIGVFIDPLNYGLPDDAPTKWDQSTQSCKKKDAWSGYEPFF